MFVQIIGRTGSGKSTAAKVLTAALQKEGIDAKVVAFTAPLKKLCRHFFGHSDESLKEIPVALRDQSITELVTAIEYYTEDMNIVPTREFWQYLEDNLLNRRTISPCRVYDTVGHATRLIDKDAFKQHLLQNATGFCVVEDTRFKSELLRKSIVLYLNTNRGITREGIDELMQRYPSIDTAPRDWRFIAAYDLPALQAHLNTIAKQMSTSYAQYARTST